MLGSDAAFDIDLAMQSVSSLFWCFIIFGWKFRDKMFLVLLILYSWFCLGQSAMHTEWLLSIQMESWVLFVESCSSMKRNDMTLFFYCCRYWFQTPEGWTTDGHYRSLVYMRPLAIWAIQYALSPPKAILEAPKVNLMDRIHISPHVARAISEISIRKIAPDNRCFPSSAFNCECWSKGNSKLLSNLQSFCLFWFLFAPFPRFSGVPYRTTTRLGGSKELLYNCTANCWSYNLSFLHFEILRRPCNPYLSCPV